ncbi:MAG: hypothetical protein U5L45_12535 [Saprospiraceae bacterium]|nr:hypothetical protein [Saprospiraceae bacterium]
MRERSERENQQFRFYVWFQIKNNNFSVNSVDLFPEYTIFDVYTEGVLILTSSSSVNPFL